MSAPAAQRRRRRSRARLAAARAGRARDPDDSAEHVGHAGAAAGGGHFSLLIVSEHFRGLPAPRAAPRGADRVGDLLPHPVHALSIRAFAPDEFPS